MENFKMTRNASGYYDETAYKGIMGMAKPGEIWECTNANGTSEYLIIKNHERISTALKLLEFNLDHTIAVFGKSVDPRAVQYIYNDTLSRRTNELPEEDFTEICNEIAEALDLPSMTVCELTKRPEAKKEEPEIYESVFFREIVDLFGVEAFEQYCRCAVHVSRCREDAEKAQMYLSALRTVRGGASDEKS